MATRKPSKPKFTKMPKQPKSNASVDAWKRYEARIKAVDAENAKKIAEYKKQLAAYEAEQRKKESIKSAANKAKARLGSI